MISPLRRLLAAVLCASVFGACSNEANPAAGLRPYLPVVPTTAPTAAPTVRASGMPGVSTTSSPTTPAPPMSTPVPSATPTAAVAGAGETLQAGQIALPAGVALPLASLRVTNSIGSTTPAASGAFVAVAYAGGPQFTVVTDGAGDPVVMGFLGGNDTTLNATSTAEALAFFGGAFYALPSPYRAEMVDAVTSAPGFAALQSAVASALVANPTGLASSTNVSSALTTFVTTLYAPGATSSAATILRAARARPRPNDVLVNPSNAQSGITAINDFPDGVHLMNTYRRAAEAFFDRDSYVDASGVRHADAAQDVAPPQQIPATSGLGSVTSSLASAVAGVYSGATAYTPTTTDSVPLANESMAGSTRYLVTVVGAGPGTAANLSLRGEESDAQHLLVVQQLIRDFVVPVVTAVVIPIDSSQIDTALGYDGGNAALADLISTLTTAAPQIYQLENSGQTADALTAAFNAVATSNTVQAAFLQFVLGQVQSAAGAGAAQAFFMQTTGLLNKLNVLSGALVGADVAVVAQNIASSNDADQFVVDVTADKVTLTPATSTIGFSATQTLTAAVVAQSDSGQALVWQWTNTAAFGHLTDGIAGHTDTFMSSSANVTYTANSTQTGSDTVTVTPFVKMGATMTQIGMPASATVTVQPSICNGDFTQGFACWTQTIVNAGGFSGYPRFRVATSDTCLSDPDGVPFYTSDVPGGAESLLTQSITVPSGSPQLSMLTWGNLDTVTVSIDVTPAGGPTTVVGSFTPPPLSSSETDCSSATPQVVSFDLSAFAGQTVTLGIDMTSTGYDGTIGNVTRIGFSTPSSTLATTRRRVSR